MLVPEAAAVLGVRGPVDDAELKRAYRSRLRELHPDVNASADADERTQRVVEAYEVLRRHGGSEVSTIVDASEPEPIVAVADDDTIELAMPAEDAFKELVAVGHLVGSVTYLDRHCDLFETLLTLTDGSTISVMITLQGRATSTEAFVTVEPLDVRSAPPSVRAVTTLFAHHLAERAAFPAER